MTLCPSTNEESMLPTGLVMQRGGETDYTLDLSNVAYFLPNVLSSHNQREFLLFPSTSSLIFRPKCILRKI